MTGSALPDDDARRTIAQRLGENLLVEAGAGSGKTTQLVSRAVALVRSGVARVEEIAAVTFTRKAASELRERFQDALERTLSEARAGDTAGTPTGEPVDPAAAAPAGAGTEEEEVYRLDRALRDIDRAFIGTIHAFCARLLRERPLEARLDPGFRETLEDEERRRSRRFWSLWLERAAASGDPALEDLARVSIEPSQLHDLYLELQQYEDVDFLLEEAKPPDPALVSSVRERLEELLRRARELWAGEPHPKGPDKLQAKLRTLYYLERMTRWRPDSALYEGLAALCRSASYSITQYKWKDAGADVTRAKELCEAVNRFIDEGGPARALLRQWWAHRYPVVVRFARAACAAYAEERRREGRLNFQDLLMSAARLLRESPEAREELGLRYRRLLVDEFQDTDPIQAEILFMLASSPDGDRDGAWIDLEPRPGQLFVVGDPKQSIYRFRRADISIYDSVRRRFSQMGDVVRLTSNFRSRPAIARLVNDTFRGEGAFPDEPTAAQAAFAPLQPKRRDEPACEGVFFYELEGSGRGASDIAEEDARRLAAWVRRRTRGAGADRRPGDFLILTRGKPHLAAYAAALEAWGLPVQVSGAGVSVEDELGELRLLLGALADPGDPVRLLAVLRGLFFGLDAAALLRHRDEGGRFDLRAPGDDGDQAVLDALGVLRRWWLSSRSEPADVVVGRIVDETGLVPYAAGGELGQVRAGALFYGLDAVRQVALEGDTSLAGVAEALEGVLDASEAEAPLEPGRSDAVQLMNLHKAKGLEASVVVLALPREHTDRPPTLHVERDESGTSRGWVAVRERAGWATVTHAAPMDWPVREEVERRFAEAEEVRLQYVAATRARDELVVARRPGKDDESPWSPLHGWLETHGERLDLPLVDPPEPERLSRSAEEIEREVRAAAEARRSGARPTYHFQTVTERVRSGQGTESGAAHGGPPEGGADEGGPQIDLFGDSSTLGGTGSVAPEQMASTSSVDGDPRDAEGPLLHGGPDWGSAVHAALEAVARGASGDVLRSVARAHLLEYERPVDDSGEPIELDGLLETVAAVRSSEIWHRAEAADRRLAEVPFALELPRAGTDVPTYLDGQIDLAFEEDGAWILVDYKTDRDPPAHRMRKYRRQLRAYADAWERATGSRVKECLILLTRLGEVVDAGAPDATARE